MTSYRDILLRTCLASLERFYLPDVGLLAHRMTWDGASWTTTGTSLENTANALPALYQLQRRGIASPIDPNGVMQRLMLAHFGDLDYTGVAFLLWADSIGDGGHGPVLWNALRERMPGHASQTMQLGWTLSSLCHYYLVASEPSPVERLANELYRRIIANQSERSGLFYGSGTREGWLRRRKPVTTLSSQTYPIQALALYGRVFDVAEALQRAERCAATLCQRQGAQGQWWWRYDVDSGVVVDRYPVYSVNQDSAVPMGFGELHRALGHRRYETFINHGLHWLFGHNELGRSLVDESAGVIWRAIRPQNGRFEVLPEMHSYHPARCLYALCS